MSTPDEPDLRIGIAITGEAQEQAAGEAQAEALEKARLTLALAALFAADNYGAWLRFTRSALPERLHELVLEGHNPLALRGLGYSMTDDEELEDHV